jgi:branched-chain amino acid transport system ATP-binding protein
MSSEPVLRADRLTRHFGGIAAVKDFSCHIEQREILGLIGPNGAGKSTTFNLISGFIRPHAGEVWFEGVRIDRMKAAAISRLGLVRTFQHGSIFRNLSVRDNVLVGTTHVPGGVAAREILAGEMLELFGLSGLAGDIAGDLPHGLQRLLAMAIAFATRPKLLCLDEPLTGLNQVETAGILRVISNLREQRGTAILFVEHNVHAVMKLCDRIVVLDRGSKLTEGSPAEIRNDAAVIKAYLGEDA